MNCYIDRDIDRYVVRYWYSRHLNQFQFIEVFACKKSPPYQKYLPSFAEFSSAIFTLHIYHFCTLMF